MTLRVDLYSPAGVKLDVPPLADTDILGCSYGLTLNAIGTFTLRIAAGCLAATNATPGRQIWIYNEPTEGLVFKGIISDSEFTEDSAGQATFNLTGFSLGCQLNWKSALIGRDYEGELLTDVIDDLLTDTAFTAGTVQGGTVTRTFDGISIWESLSKLASMFGAVLREDNINSEIDFVDVLPRQVQAMPEQVSDGGVETATVMSIIQNYSNNDLDATTDWAGIRFPNITVPRGATVTSAIFSTTFSNSTSDEPDLLFYGEKVADSVTFTTAASNVSGRARTTATVAWSNTDLGEATGNERFDAPDMKTIVQEIIDQPTWVSGNAISFLVQGSSDANRDAQMGLAGAALTDAQKAKLIISYSLDVDETVATFRKFPEMPTVLTQDLLPITSFKKRDQGIDIVNRIIAIAEQKQVGGDARWIDLSGATRSEPYTVQTDTGPDGFPYYYIEDTDSQAIYGVRERTIKFSGISLPGFATIAGPSNQLYEAAVSYLQQRLGTIAYYDAQIVGLQHYVGGVPSLEVGNLARVQYSANTQDLDGVREYLAVDEQLFVVDMKRTFDSAGADTWALQFATEAIPLQTRDSILGAIAVHAMDGSVIPLPRRLLSVGGDAAHTEFKTMINGQFSWLTDNTGQRIRMIDIDKTVPAGLGSTVSDTFTDGTPVQALFMVACYRTDTGASVGHIFGSGAVGTILYAITTATSASNGAATPASISLNASGGFSYEANAAAATRLVGIAIVAYSD